MENGQRITIARHGHPVAEPLPASDERRRRVAVSVATLEELRGGRKVDGVAIRQLVDEGRRY